jgi:hypothetical protein
MLCRRKPHLVVEYEDHDADWMLSQLTHVLKCELAEHPNSDPNKPQDSAE